VLLVLLDMPATFDTLNHDRLLQTLERLRVTCSGFHPIFMAALRVFLLEARHLNPSHWEGSVLGPLLFTIYSAGLGSVIRHRLMNYQLLMILKSTSVHTQISCRAPWLLLRIALQVSATGYVDIIWNLTKQKPKCFSYLPNITQPNARCDGEIGNSNITPKCKVRNLGATMDNRESMVEHHVNNMCRIPTTSRYLQTETIFGSEDNGNCAFLCD
jgi:hypothetical protein